MGSIAVAFVLAVTLPPASVRVLLRNEDAVPEHRANARRQGGKLGPTHDGGRLHGFRGEQAHADQSETCPTSSRGNQLGYEARQCEQCSIKCTGEERP